MTSLKKIPDRVQSGLEPSQKILVVDDEPDILEILEAMLVSKGYVVSLASNGDQALDRIRQDAPDLVLLDVMMPRMDGFEVCRRLKSEDSTRNIPVLLLTALQDTADKVKGLDSGADDFISKPFKDAEVLARVRAFLRSKHLHDALEASYRKLKELEHLRDSLTHMIIHDLKAPLTIVKGNVDLVTDILSSNPKMGYKDVEPYLRAGQHSAEIMNTLITDLLDVSRLENKEFPLSKFPASLTEIAEGCLKQLEPLARKNSIVVQQKLEPGIPSVPLDRTLMERVITNLLSNAFKFTPQGGSVTLSVRALQQNRCVECAVEDTGPGIPEKDLGRIFDKFFQGTGFEITRKGQGLGLAFCRMAVEAHHGSITVESKPGQGSRFAFRLPME